MTYDMKPIRKSMPLRYKQWEQLLQDASIDKDEHLDETIGLFNNEGLLCASGSYYSNTLRCLAVNPERRGEGLLERIVLEIKRRRYLDGVTKLFVYTKPEAAMQLEPLGFYEVAIAYPDVVFMESEQGGFTRYLQSLTPVEGDRIGAIIMNANPFTKGHLYLIEQALKICDVLHLFVVSEDRSFFPYKTRKMLVQQGTQHLSNVHIHDTDDYMISSAVFPAYFLHTVDKAASAEARLDAAIFSKVAKRLNITRRFVGDEPLSPTTNLYNQALLASLPKEGIEVTVIPRLEAGDAPISASRVRKAIAEGEIASLSGLLPKTTYQYLLSEEGQALITKKR